MIAKYWDKLGQIGRGGNGIWQVPELLVIICMYLFTLYSLICICLMTSPDAAFLGILLAGAGGGSIAYVADKKFNRPKKKDTPSEDEGEIIG